MSVGEKIQTCCILILIAGTLCTSKASVVVYITFSEAVICQYNFGEVATAKSNHLFLKCVEEEPYITTTGGPTRQN